MKTSELVEIAAQKLALPKATVDAVLKTLLETIAESLLKKDKVIITNFGVFTAGVVNGTMPGVVARFRAAKELKAKLKEQFKEEIKPMEKLGVELDNEAALLAKVTKKCPKCQGDLVETDPPQCSACGTEPFEAVRKDNRKLFQKKS